MGDERAWVGLTVKCFRWGFKPPTRCHTQSHRPGGSFKSAPQCPQIAVSSILKPGKKINSTEADRR
jgi:hypothetical protein